MLDTYSQSQDDGGVSFETDDLAAVGYLSSSTELLGLLGLTYLFLQSYWNNRRLNLTGRLYYDGLDYGIILEGEKTRLARLARIIERDGRHKIRQKFHIQNINQRHYDDWQMRFDGADTVAHVLPNYRHAIGEINGQTADQVMQLMTLYRV
ncbi:BLUF domain-containing protein [Orrella daihaiensis]|uniref:BLUF domain-containing protein n=1 Tax=Orrella daihaiensis TaxID=2782176 RepID=A0ABY4AHL8_9BURK|nr:BLUF domain-containing protein [Orrella daihaiensis]UOD49785.1 BLUF domain-containing protein [Orrella daihaiensis]